MKIVLSNSEVFLCHKKLKSLKLLIKFQEAYLNCEKVKKNIHYKKLFNSSFDVTLVNFRREIQNLHRLSVETFLDLILIYHKLQNLKFKNKQVFNKKLNLYKQIFLLDCKRIHRLNDLTYDALKKLVRSMRNCVRRP